MESQSTACRQVTESKEKSQRIERVVREGSCLNKKSRSAEYDNKDHFDSFAVSNTSTVLGLQQTVHTNVQTDIQSAVHEASVRF